MNTKFSLDISTQLKTIATDAELEQLRQIVNEVERNPANQAWRLPLLAMLIEDVQRWLAVGRRGK